MIPGETALEIHGVGFADGAVGREFNGAALNEGAGSHDDVGVVTGHGPGLGSHVAVHRGGSLDAAAEGHHSLAAAQSHGLDDVVAALGGVGHTGKAQLFIDISCKHSALECAGNHGGGEEQTLVECGHDAEVCAHFLTQTGSGETVSAALHALLGAADVTADGGKAATGVLDEAAHDHIGAHVGGLDGFHKLAVAVIHHDLHVGLDGLAEGDELADLSDGEGGAGGVALGALDGDELGTLVDLFADGVVVKGTVGLEIGLGVGDAVLLQRALAGADADDLFQGVIGSAHGREQLVAGEEVGREGNGQSVSAAGDLGTHQRGLGVEHVGIDALEVVTAFIVVTVAGGGGKVGGVHAVFLHGGKDFGLIIFGDLIDGIKAVAEVGEDLFAEGIYSGTDTQLSIHCVEFHKFHPF